MNYSPALPPLAQRPLRWRLPEGPGEGWRSVHTGRGQDSCCPCWGSALPWGGCARGGQRTDLLPGQPGPQNRETRVAGSGGDWRSVLGCHLCEASFRLLHSSSLLHTPPSAGPAFCHSVLAALSHRSVSLLAFVLKSVVNMFISPLTLGNFEGKDYLTPYHVPRGNPGAECKKSLSEGLLKCTGQGWGDVFRDPPHLRQINRKQQHEKLRFFHKKELRRQGNHAEALIQTPWILKIKVSPDWLLYIKDLEKLGF